MALPTLLILIDSQTAYLIIWETTPAPTVRSPSRMAKRIPCSIAIALSNF
ncbi:hypothetical protein [Microcoleus sp. A2-D3]